MRKTIAWAVIAAAIALLLWFTLWCWYNARTVSYVLLGVIGGGLLRAVLIWAIEEVTGW